MRGFLAIMRSSQDPRGAPQRAAQRTTATAPMMRETARITVCRVHRHDRDVAILMDDHIHAVGERALGIGKERVSTPLPHLNERNLSLVRLDRLVSRDRQLRRHSLRHRQKRPAGRRSGFTDHQRHA